MIKNRLTQIPHSSSEYADAENAAKGMQVLTLAILGEGGALS